MVVPHIAPDKALIQAPARFSQRLPDRAHIRPLDTAHVTCPADTEPPADLGGKAAAAANRALHRVPAAAQRDDTPAAAAEHSAAFLPLAFAFFEEALGSKFPHASFHQVMVDVVAGNQWTYPSNPATDSAVIVATAAAQRLHFRACGCSADIVLPLSRQHAAVSVA